MARAVPLNGVLIRSLREELGLTIEEAAAKVGCSSRAWEKFEAGSSAFRRTVQAIADFFRVPFEVLTLDTSFSLISELEMFESDGVGRAVLSISRDRLRTSAEEFLYGMAILMDMSGEAGCAETMCRAVIAITPDRNRKAAAGIRLASILEHQHKVAEGLDILRQVEQNLSTEVGSDPALIYWARYQSGVLLLTIEDFEKSQRTLLDVSQNAPSEGQRLSAKHQLGVLALRCGMHEEAEGLFRICLKERSAGNFRRAFEYRRIGECCALTGRRKEAVEALKEGLKISRKAGFRRYEEEILSAVSLLGLSEDPLWLKAVARLDRRTRTESTSKSSKATSTD